MSLPFSVKYEDKVNQLIPFLGAHARSFLHDMLVKAESDGHFADVFSVWLSGNASTVYLRDNIMPLMRPSNGKVAVHPKYCTCCKKTHGSIRYRNWDAFHDTPWEALDSASGRFEVVV